MPRKEFWIWNKSELVTVSSAYQSTEQFRHIWGNSLIQIETSSGPRIESWALSLKTLENNILTPYEDKH